MSHFDPSLLSLPLSRRRMIVGGSVGLLATTVSAQQHEATAATFINGGTAEDHIAIRQLLYRYAMSIDLLDAAAFADCFAENAVLWGAEIPKIPRSSFRLQGKDITKPIEWNRPFAYTMHNVLNHAFTVKGDTAQGLTYCVACGVQNKAGTWVRTDSYIHYQDALVKQAGRWRFIDRQYKSFFTTETPIQNFTEDESRKRR